MLTCWMIALSRTILPTTTCSSTSAPITPRSKAAVDLFCRSVAICCIPQRTLTSIRAASVSSLPENTSELVLLCVHRCAHTPRSPRGQLAILRRHRSWYAFLGFDKISIARCTAFVVVLGDDAVALTQPSHLWRVPLTPDRKCAILWSAYLGSTILQAVTLLCLEPGSGTHQMMVRHEEEPRWLHISNQ